jgi:hypothetical protein
MKLAHPKFVWMISGLAGGDLGWIRDDIDQCWKYQVNLARFNVRGVDLTCAHVLDTGSGRGGNCHYLARHLLRPSLSKA